MSGQNDLTTTVPKITLADISDPTLHRLNLILERLFGLVAVTDQKASDLGRKIYRAEGVSVNAGYTPPTPGGEAPVWSPLDPPAVPTGITAALVTDPGGDRFGFRTTWSAPSPPGGTVKYDVWCKFYGYDEAESGWTYDEGSEESDFIPLGGTDELFLESGYWALPDHTQRVKIWVRALNGVDEATARVEASYPAPGYIEVSPSAVATTAPDPPTAVTVTPLDKDGNYGLKTTWTPPSPIGTATDYQVEAGFWTDSGLNNNDVDADDAKNWIPLGGTHESQLVSGFWPRPTDASRWAKTRVRSVNSFGGAVSAWVESSTAVEITAYTDSYVPPAAPNPPTAITLTITDSQGNFGFHSGWTAPSPLGGTVGYNVEAKYWTDSGLTTAESDWIPLGGTHETSLDSGFWPRPSSDRWVKIRVCGKNEIDELSSWVELTNAVKLEPLAAPGAPTSVSATRLAKDDNYGISTTWTAPSPIGTATDYEVQARFWLDTGLTTPDSDWIPLGGTHDVALVSGYWPRPTDVPRYGKTRVRSLNALKGYSAWVESSGYFTVEVAPSVAPAPNVSSVTASALQSADRWGFTATITWPTNRTEIDHVLVYIVGPIGTSYEMRQPWGRVSVPVSGDTTVSQEIEWERPAIGESNQTYRIEVESYNSGNVPTASPVASSAFTVTAMSNSLVVSGLSAARNPTTTNLDGVEVYGIVGSFAIPNNQEIDHAEVFVRNISDANDRERGPATSTPPGTINTTVNYATDLWALTGSSPFTIRVTVYLVNAMGQRIGSGVTADTVITPGGGSLNLGRSSSASLGRGLMLLSGTLSVAANDRLVNGDFEADLNGWSPSGAVSIENTGGISGPKWLKIGVGSGLAIQAITALAGMAKRLSARIQNTSNVNGELAAVWVNSSGSLVSTYYYASIPAGSAENTYSVFIPPAPAGASHLWVYPQLVGATSGYLKVDAVIVEDVERVTSGITRDANGNIVSTNRSLQNGDFENDLSSWTTEGTVSIENSGGVSGPKWCKLVGNGAYTVVKQEVIAVPGQTKRLSARIENTSNGLGLIQGVWVDSAGSHLPLSGPVYYYKTIPAGSGLETYSVQIGTAPTDAAFLLCYVELPGTATTGHLKVDAVILEDAERLGAGSTRDANGFIVPNLGPGTELDGSNRIVPNLGPGLELNGSNEQTVKVNNTEIRINSSTQQLELYQASISKLIAGTANFSGTATFQYNSANRVVIDSTGVTVLADANNYVSTSASGLTIKGGGKTVQISSTNITMTQDTSNSIDLSVTSGLVLKGSGRTVRMDSSGISMTNDTNNKIDVTSTGVTITGYGKTLMASSSGVSITNDVNNKVTVTPTGVTITGSGNTLVASSSGIVLTNGSNSVTIGTSGITLSGTTTITTPNITVYGSGFTATINPTDGIKVQQAIGSQYISLSEVKLKASNYPHVTYFGPQGLDYSYNNQNRLVIQGAGSYCLIQLKPPTDGIGALNLWAEDARGYVACGLPNSFVSFPGSGSYCYFSQYRFPISNIGTQEVPATFSNWVAIYDSVGNFRGKMPLF